jgi:hypothetical protein
MAEPTSSKLFAPSVRALLFLALDSAEFASALEAAGPEEREFAQEILYHMIEKNVSRNAELEERMEKLSR